MTNKFISGLAGICLGLATVCSSQTETDIDHRPAIINSQVSLLDKIKESNVELRSEFTHEELKDIVEVIDAYTNVISSISRYKISIGKYERDNDPMTVKAQSNPTSQTYEPCLEFRGYHLRGNLDPNNLNISVAPKDAIDGKFRYEQEHKLIPRGEEGKKHDFKWVLIHEIGHYLLHKTGAQKRFDPNFNNPEDGFFSQWGNLQLETSKKCTPLSYNEQSKWENIRPQGYPSHYSYFANSGEQFAELIAYCITGSHYADNDSVLMKKLVFTKDWLASIKN